MIASLGASSTGEPVHPGADVGFSNACLRQHHHRCGGGLGRRDHRRRGRCCGFPRPSTIGGLWGGIAKDEALIEARRLLAGFQVFKESKVLVWIFWGLSLPQVVLFVYVVYAVSCAANT